uniref:putative bifunctional diguanylate cyclase/phosphodiesterase n=1 Tax=Stappia sp. TaxID=1870903 RepID=UPI003BA95CBB
MRRALLLLRPLIPRTPRTLSLLLLAAGVLACLIAARGISTLREPEPDAGQHVIRHMRYTYAELASLDTLLATLQINPFTPAAHTMLADAADHFYVRLQMLSGLSQGPFADDSTELKRLSVELMAGLDALARAGPPLNDRSLSELNDISSKVLRLTGDYTREVEARIDSVLREHARRATGAWTEIITSITLMLILSILSLSLFFRNRRMMDDLRAASARDSLTGLTNRRGFTDWATEREARDENARRRHALLVFDIDHFKAVNDQFGHATGDAMLKAAARSLLADFPDAGLIARWGGDEFVVAVPLSDLSLREIDERLSTRANTPSQVNGPSDARLPIAMSCGVAVWPDDGATIDEALTCADAALYEAKARQRGAHVFFREEMLDRQRLLQEIASGLPAALPRQELFVTYEPRICINRRALVGARAHLRWAHPGLSATLAAGDFMAGAREHGQARAFDSFLLATACETVARWRASIPEQTYVVVGLSACSLRDATLVEEIDRLLTRSGLPPEALEIEVADEAALSRSEEVIETLSRLSEHGVRLALSTFGKGNGVLTLLARLRPQVLTINKTLLCESVPGDCRADVAALANMAETLGARTLIEGVATDADLDMARDAACALAEGPGVSPPLPAPDICAFARALRSGAPRPARIATPSAT